MANNARQAKVISPEEAEKLRYPLSETWKKAAGILRGRRIDPLLHQKQARDEWNERTKNLEKLARKAPRSK